MVIEDILIFSKNTVKQISKGIHCLLLTFKWATNSFFININMCIYIYIHISISSICLRKWKVRQIKLTEASIKKAGSGKVYVKVFCTVLAHFLVLKIISKMKKFQQYSSYNVSFFVSSPDTPALSSGLLRLRTSPIICFPGSTLSGPLFPLSQILSFVSSAYVMCHILQDLGQYSLLLEDF